MNKTFLMGRITKDPELQRTSGGTAYVKSTVAVNESYKDKEGKWKDKANFIDLVLWGPTAERFAERAKKGCRVNIEGRLQQSRWETKTGEKRSRIEVKVDRIQYLDINKKKDVDKGEEPDEDVDIEI